MFNLSKSKYTESIKCMRSLWLSTHSREKRELSIEQSHFLREGERVGALAREFFPGGVLIEFDHKNFKKMADKTRELIESGVNTIYEATFLQDGIVVLVDILHRQDGEFGIYEVKSTPNPKDIYIDDLSIQWHVVKTQLDNLTSASLLLLDKEYKRSGNLEPKRLFRRELLTDVVKSRATGVTKRISEIRGMLAQDEPVCDIGSQCDKGGQGECQHIGHCWSKYDDLRLVELYRQKKKGFELLAEGVAFDEGLERRLKLNNINKLQIRLKDGDEPLVDPKPIGKFLDSLRYPVSYLDFEWTQESIPRFEGSSVFERIPFQFSIQIQDEPNGVLREEGYLNNSLDDPRKTFLEELLRLLPRTGSVVAFNAATAEIAVLNELARLFPTRKNELDSVVERFIDPLEVFRKGWFYAPSFKGSFSMKAIHPFFVPNKSYVDQKIKGGNQAVVEYLRMISLDDSSEQKEIYEDLWRYCALDTRGMAEVIEGVRGYLG